MADPSRRLVDPTRDPIAPVAEGVVQVDAIQHLPAVLRELGLDPGASIAAAGLDPRAFDDPVNEIPIAALGSLLARAAAASGRDDVGLLVGQRTPPASLGLVGLLTRHSPDVGTALRNLSAHLHLRDRGAIAPFHQTNGIAMLGYEIYQPGIEGGDQICDGGMAIAMNIMREICGPAWRPTEVLFAHSRPVDPRPFRRFFAAPLRFDAERTALVFASEWLGHRTRGADPARFRELTDRVCELESAVAGDLVAELRRLLRVMLLAGKVSVGEVADQLSMHRRTLNRRLRAHGTSLHQLVEQTRFEISRQLMENTRMPLADIAAVLGYADASAFTRAFQRWTGCAPSAWRKQPRGASVANCQAVRGTATYAGQPRQQRAFGRASG